MTLILGAISAQFLFADISRQIEGYIKEAEYSQDKKANNYCHELQYYLMRGDDHYNAQFRYAANAEVKAANNLRQQRNY